MGKLETKLIVKVVFGPLLKLGGIHTAASNSPSRNSTTWEEERPSKLIFVCEATKVLDWDGELVDVSL